MARSIPEGFNAVSPILSFKDARKAIDFYKKAFGAKEHEVFPGPEGKGIMHADLTIGDSHVMLSEESPDKPSKSAETLGASPVTFYLYVSDADATFKLAVAAGAKSSMPVKDMFWGDRVGSVTDPFGYTWTLATHVKDVSSEEMTKAAQEFYAHSAKK